MLSPNANAKSVMRTLSPHTGVEFEEVSRYLPSLNDFSIKFQSYMPYY